MARKHSFDPVAEEIGMAYLVIGILAAMFISAML